MVRFNVESNRCQLGGDRLMVQCLIKTLFCFKSDTPYQILSLLWCSFSWFFSRSNSTNPVELLTPVQDCQHGWNGQCFLVSPATMFFGKVLVCTLTIISFDDYLCHPKLLHTLAAIFLCVTLHTFGSQIQLDCRSATRTQKKSICQQTVRATTLSRPPLESSRRGGFRCIRTIFV